MSVIKGGTLVTGDGKTVIKNAYVRFENDLIVDFGEGECPTTDNDVIDAAGCVVMPGVIDHHIHGVTMGPLFPSGAKPLSREKVSSHHKKLLEQGITTILNVDGFATMREVNEARAMTPLRIQTCTSHTATNFKAALAGDGSGLTEEHLNTTVEQMLKEGAIMVGEIGGGHTLGGGGQDYLYIPKAIKEKTGVELEPMQARRLKVAVLGRHINLDNYDSEAVKAAMKEFGLDGLMSEEEMKQTICDCVLPSMDVALDAFTEAAQAGMRYGVPSLYHNSAPSAERIIELSEKYPNIIAAHSAHPSFELQEALEVARIIKENGGLIDLATIDCYGAKKICDSTESFTAFYKEDLVDMISTDYAGGNWDSPLCTLEQVVREGSTTLEKAVATATGNVAKMIPGIAPNAGVIACGKLADIILVDENDLANVKRVIIGGKTIVHDGKLID